MDISIIKKDISKKDTFISEITLKYQLREPNKK